MDSQMPGVTKLIADTMIFIHASLILLYLFGYFQKIGGIPPKWMVKIMETPIKIHDLGGFYTPIFGSTPI